MNIIIELVGTENNKIKQCPKVVRAATLFASSEPSVVYSLGDPEVPETPSCDNTITHDNGGFGWDNMPWTKAVTHRLSHQRPASVDVLVLSKTPPKNARHTTAMAFIVNVDDEHIMEAQLKSFMMSTRAIKDARRYNSLVSLGTMRQIGSAGFNGRERIKNEHYYHMTFDMWSTGYEGAYDDDYAANLDMFNIYTDALINNFKNGMDGRTENEK